MSRYIWTWPNSLRPTFRQQNTHKIFSSFIVFRVCKFLSFFFILAKPIHFMSPPHGRNVCLSEQWDRRECFYIRQKNRDMKGICVAKLRNFTRLKSNWCRMRVEIFLRLFFARISARNVVWAFRIIIKSYSFTPVSTKSILVTIMVIHVHFVLKWDFPYSTSLCVLHISLIFIIFDIVKTKEPRYVKKGKEDNIRERESRRKNT